jgi:hypothetical protein
VGVLVSAWYWSGGAVWDDHRLIVDHLTQIPWSELPSLWWRPVGLGATGATYYRPLAMALLAVFGRVGIPALHVLAGLVHGANAGLICGLGGRTRGALLGALVFAAHPVVGEVLGWASALPDALSVLAGLTVLALGGTRRPVWLGAVALAGLWCKETTLVWLVPGLLGGWLDRRDGFAVVGAVAIWAGLRMGAGVVAPSMPLSPGVWTVLEVWLGQLGTLVWPLPLPSVRDTHHIGRARLVCGGLVVLSAMGAALRGSGRTRWLVAAVLLPPLIALPTTLSSHLAGDRYVYASVAALALLVGQSAASSRLLGSAGVVALLLWLGVHRPVAQAWRTDHDLFARTLESQPESAYAWHFLGHARALSGDWRTAADAFETASSLPHHHPAAKQLALEAMVMAGAFARAVELGRGGGTDGLTADWLAWWARAELGAGHTEEAARLIAPLKQPDGSWDGPEWVAELAGQITASP